jgi:HlyD family secretion protein
MRIRATRVRAVPLITSALAALSACADEHEPDAYGTFEAVEVVVSSQTGGQVHEFKPEEGMQLPLGTVAAVIDTAQLALERQQILAQRNASSSRSTEVSEQLGVLEVERDIAQRTYERTRRLHAARAATAQQLDQAEREYRTIMARIQAVQAQRASVGMDVTANDARVDQIADRIAKSIITNPQAGTVLTTYTRTGEIVQPGQPLYRIADLRTLVLRAYVTGAQLASVRLGQSAQVHVDQGDDELLALTGTVTWIASEAEFTPTPIQTREERADLVYAVKVLVANPDGVLRIGMPGDVTFSREPRSAELQP